MVGVGPAGSDTRWAHPNLDTAIWPAERRLIVRYSIVTGRSYSDRHNGATDEEVWFGIEETPRHG